MPHLPPIRVALLCANQYNKSLSLSFLGTFMARTQSNSQQSQQLLKLLGKLPKSIQLVLFLVGVAAFIGVTLSSCPATSPKGKPTGGYTGDGKELEVSFCTWNVENFFDDKDDEMNHDESEDFFAKNPDMFAKKVDRLSDGLLMMNGGAGPDIMALVEVESLRCLEVLMEKLNEKLGAKGFADRKYQNILFKGDNMGRRFAPGIITRLPVIADKTKKIGARGNGRILRGSVSVNDHELVIIAAHFTSRVTDDAADGKRRMSYANDCYGELNRILQAEADADVIICGDLNDEFNDKSIQEGLSATKSFDTCKDGKEKPRPLALFADLSGNDPPGTIFGKGKFSTFDHIFFARGLLDNKGWSGDPKTAEVFAPKEFRFKGKGPFRFGDGKGDVGYSDHFPVLCKFKVAAKSDK